ncbi:hypothetical protein ACSCB1_43530 [Streptomyces europaeiscabiei]|uniref:Uncharacterized protein n=1 Tax=Streptomyces europaeiscabiei TaxID=146819 RepID=A0ABU4NGF4_9ACTN|nr:hypothetical protein [Streptomyces europaeiscabiei]MDX2763404.1 hypothetical protein [Streptomyces europaeiscabiei]MDX2775125.1 hypothetical protein [Streptomyces europaeiscabiei]MDX3544758.1 hypothetical protein [Streptomyces europaeiscabiei]MDX3554108.1 hypothetical protein [Streptomyces europaeiscabiei]MDX3702226.1 hypothetical protein [Streptomyces europaeiscabiei]
MTENTDAVVRAAGRVLWRRSPDGADLRIRPAHRPQYDESCHRSSR